MATSAPAGRPAPEVIARLRSRLMEQLARCVPAGPVSLVDFPNHPNVGDSAIWLGEHRALGELGATIVHSCEGLGFDEAALRRSLGADSTILLHGGGNFGDVWPRAQAIRERVVRAFPEHRIVQLPQTIHFAQEENVKRARDVLGRHPRLTVLCRDWRSLTIAREELGLDAAVCPDVAFALDLERAPVAATVPVLWLARTDTERRGVRFLPAAGDPAVRVVDWFSETPADPGWTRRYDLTRTFARDWVARMTKRPWLVRPTRRLALATHRHLAAGRLRFGTELLSSGEVLVTDRLHGHILALLLDLPHVVVDTGYGKLVDFIDTWTAPAARLVRAGSARDALDAAHAARGAV